MTNLFDIYLPEPVTGCSVVTSPVDDVGSSLGLVSSMLIKIN